MYVCAITKRSREFARDAFQSSPPCDSPSELLLELDLSNYHMKIYHYRTIIIIQSEFITPNFLTMNV
jgi:hypothetical protein